MTSATEASASETYRSGSGVGVHGDAQTTCSSRPQYTVQATPVMGTTPGWEWGQNVAYKIYVLNARTNGVVGTLNNNNWTYRRIATKWTTHEIWGPMEHVVPTASLPNYSWTLPAGDYRVRIDYAWHTNQWNYATNVTSHYFNMSAFGQSWMGTWGTSCVIR